MVNAALDTRRSPSCAGGGLAEDSAGFSLVEMLIGVVVTGVVGAAVVGIFVEQSGFYQENSRRVMANKSLRVTADRMSTELRMVRQGDVRTAEADEVTVRYGVTSGVVCHTDASTVYVYLHRLPGDMPPDTIRYLEPRFQGVWQNPNLLWSDLQADGSETCADHGSPSGKASDRYREITSLSTTPQDGSLVYGTISLTYEFVDQNGDIALLRNGTRLAIPFEESQAYFRYFRGDGTELSSPVTGSDRNDIAYIRVDATAQGHDPNQRYQGDRSMNLRIPLRN